MQEINDVFYMKKYMDCFCVPGMSKHFTGIPHILEDSGIIYPFFRRKVNIHSSDFVTPYGYGGAIATTEATDVDWPSFLYWKQQMILDNNVVTEFVRHHPFFETQRITQEAEQAGKLVWIDLTNESRDIVSSMEKSCRNAVTKAKREGVEIVSDKSKNQVRLFWALYKKTMARAKADKKYFFPLEFFCNIRRLLKKESTFTFARYKGRVIAAALTLHKGKNSYYFLSGSLNENKTLCPTNLLVYDMIFRMKDLGYERLLLGGGLKPNDSLFRFKQSFSKDTIDFWVSKVIHDHDAYKKLCGGEIPNGGFFPAYRRDK